MNTLRFLFIGDVVGATGRVIFQKYIKQLVREYAIDSVIVNGENSGNGGRGITPKIVDFFKHNGVDIITSGNHIWDKKEIYPYLSTHNDLLRPANFPRGVPGVGFVMYECKGTTIGVINLQGRVFMKEDLDCPFKTAETIIHQLRSKSRIIFIDFHAEATSEKRGLAYHLDGNISGLVGTHTHVLTCDAQILPNGTGYITDLGMVGSLHSMLGMKKEPIIRKFLTQMPTRFVVETEGPAFMSGVWMEVDIFTGKTVDIGIVRFVDHDFDFEAEDQ
jgi:2',3'-cyclic-nucleotide 2'-phosphodiesterase